MSTQTAKRILAAPRKRRLQLSPQEEAGIVRLKATRKPATAEGKARAAAFLQFAKSNPGW